jgi:hypothetical protein
VGTTVASYAMDPFIAPWPRLAAVVVVVLGLIGLAFRLPRRVPARPGTAPAPWVVLAVMLVAGGFFMGAAKVLPTWPGVAVLLAVYAGVATAIVVWSGRAGWDRRHRLAAAAGGLVTYAWHSFTTQPLAGGGPVITPVSHVVLALAALALLLAEARAGHAMAVTRQDGVRAERS